MPSYCVSTIIRPPKVIETLDHDIPDKLNWIELRGSGWKWEKKDVQWLSIQSRTFPQEMSQIPVVSLLMDSCVITYQNIVWVQPSTDDGVLKKEMDSIAIMVILSFLIQKWRKIAKNGLKNTCKIRHKFQAYVRNLQVTYLSCKLLLFPYFC